MCGECGLWPSWDRGIIYKCVSMWRGRPGDILRGLASHTRVIIVTRESWGPQTGPAAPINITISQSPLLIKLFPPSSWRMIMSQSNVILFLPSIVDNCYLPNGPVTVDVRKIFQVLTVFLWMWAEPWLAGFNLVNLDSNWHNLCFRHLIVTEQDEVQKNKKCLHVSLTNF